MIQESNTFEPCADEIQITDRALDRLSFAHDASHYLKIPEAVATPKNVEQVVCLFNANRSGGHSITFRSGGTSLSGQGVSDGLLVDTRRFFRSLEILDGGQRVRVQPGMTVRQVNARLSTHSRKIGPDPASEIACTIGGIIANNSSGMACGTEQNTYQTLDSMIIVLPSGTIIDTGDEKADETLRDREPELWNGLLALTTRVRTNSESVSTVRRLFSMKNVMGYGVNSFLDFDRPVDVLAHLMIGSEGTLGFVAEATFRTVPLLPAAATGLAIFSTLLAATKALPALVASGLATIELMDTTSLRVAQKQPGTTPELALLQIENHAALLLEFQANNATELEFQVSSSAQLFAELPLIAPLLLTSDARIRANLWHIRKGLYTLVAGSRPSGTTALLEDIVVPVPALLETCEKLTQLFDMHGYEDSVIFGHAKDGNIHFMLNERFEDPIKLERYKRFTEDMVDLVLLNGGSLKAEHGTGRVMAPFVRRQYGDELYEVMKEIKRLCDPTKLLNPGVVLSDDPESYVQDLKLVPKIEEEVDRCVECGYCEPTCPSKNVTMTPRQRIVIRREMKNAEVAGDTNLLAELRKDYEYDGVETCAVDGMCQLACPVNINTGDLVRRLRRENESSIQEVIWKSAAKHWRTFLDAAGTALTVADGVPASLVSAITKTGRAFLGADTVPHYHSQLPRGGVKRHSQESMNPQAVYFPACIGTMFGSTTDSEGVSKAFLSICERADVQVSIPVGIASLCCGTPWKSKGFVGGYEHMSSVVLPALWQASRGGELPIVCDAASCTEGLNMMRDLASKSDGPFSRLRFMDAIEFVHDHILDQVQVKSRIESIAVHHTCSSTQLGINEKMNAIARAIADEVYIPFDWGCCAFAGDRGLLHPELTASATEAESVEIKTRQFAGYASANRTCELGMTRATGQEYRHILEFMNDAT